MELLKVVNNVGIFLECEDENFKKYIINEILERQLMGFEKKGEFNQKLIINPFYNIDIEKEKGTVVIENSINNEKFISFSKVTGNFAFMKLNNDELNIWVDKTTNISIPYILGMLIKSKKKYFVHAAGINLNGKGILLPAFGGIGKTIFISKALKDPNIKLLGDDLVIIDGEGYLYPYERPFCIYNYHKPLFKEFFKKEKPKFKKVNIFNRMIRKIQSIFKLKEYIFSYVLANPRKLFPEHSFMEANEKVKLEKIYLLRRNSANKILSKERIDKNYIEAFITNVIYHEWDIYLRMQHRFMAENGIKASEFYFEYENGIRNAIEKVKDIFVIDIPIDMDPETTSEKLSEMIL